MFLAYVTVTAHTKVRKMWPLMHVSSLNTSLVRERMCAISSNVHKSHMLSSEYVAFLGS